jgi:hypothetical protein
MLDLFMVLDHVTNAEGVSYAVFISSLATILASFIAILGVLMNILNTRLMRIEDKQDKANESLFLIKAKLGIVRIEDELDDQKAKSEN